MLLIQLMQLTFLISIGSSLAEKNVFIDPSSNPFHDTYIENVLQMKVQDILSIPKLNDSDFLKLLDGEISDDYIFSKRSISTTAVVPFDRSRDDELIHRPDIDEKWENLMISGPIAIIFYGNLLAVASAKDYSLQTPGFQYRFIRFPDSMRATLAQLGTEMYNALMGAHTGMYDIQLRVQTIPNHVKTTLRIITSGSDAMVKSMLPGTLDRIESVALSCSSIADKTLDLFKIVQDLISEIIEVSTSTQSNREQDVQLVEELKQNTTLERERLAETLDLVKTRYEDSKKELEQARELYVIAMQNLTESNDPQINAETKGASALKIGLLALISPAAAIGCALQACNSVTYRVDNSKFENAMNTVKVAQADLLRAEMIHNERFQQLLIEQNQLARTISDMAKLKLDQMTNEEIIDLLKKSMVHISAIEKQWSSLVRFFNILATEATVAREVAVKDFTQVISKAQAHQLLVNPFDREFFLEMIMPTVADIESNSKILYNMAGTYYMVSSKYMINQIAGIRANLVLTTNQERDAFLQDSWNKTQVTSREISAFAQARHVAYLQDLHSRQEEYENYKNELMAQSLTGSLG